MFRSTIKLSGTTYKIQGKFLELKLYSMCLKLVDAATFMLTVDLVTCGEIITGITSLPQTVFIIGKWVHVNDYSNNLLQSFKTRYRS